jgi:hypothetical protein
MSDEENVNTISFFQYKYHSSQKYYSGNNEEW